MTMMQKIQAKKSKKGFTLVELVIVIAILAILAAIAIPVITTTINSSKLSTMKSDMATTDMLLKEAINTSKASIYTTTYKGLNFKDNADTITVQVVLEENNVTPPSGDWGKYFQRNIGSKTYKMCYYTGNDGVKFAVVDTSTNKTTDGTTPEGTAADLAADVAIKSMAPEGAAS
ncbi:MAG: prepilin-type N-terminal cleavage/methylation domain-containing protein [Clostridia bacterium]|nr:prepilin-type N-terminal cleavage/methylation domain-containing protein [Clostridia bacterium]